MPGPVPYSGTMQKVVPVHDETAPVGQVLHRRIPQERISDRGVSNLPWHKRFHAWMVGTLPPVGWGLGRLDAVGIIFNRLSGLDVGPPPDLLSWENMLVAASSEIEAALGDPIEIRPCGRCPAWTLVDI